MAYKDRETQLAAQMQHYEDNRDVYMCRMRRRRNLRKAWFQRLLEDLSCVGCGESDPECLDMHHYNPSLKDGQVSSLLTGMKAALSTALREIEKYVCLCANCHRRHHAGTLKIRLTAKMCVKIPTGLMARTDADLEQIIGV